MRAYAVGAILFIFQCLLNGGNSNVDINVKGNILFSNQDLVEKNIENVHVTKKTILSRQKIFEYLKFLVEEKDVNRLKELLEYLNPKELRHIDFLIYLIGYYKSAAPFIVKVIFEILMEDERALEKLLSNFGVEAKASNILKNEEEKKTNKSSS